MLKDYPIVLAANGIKPLQIVGNFVRCMSISGAATINIRLSNRAQVGGDPLMCDYTTFTLGEALGPFARNFDTIEVIETIGTPTNVTLAIGDAPVQDSRFLVSALAITGAIYTKPFGSSGDTSVASGNFAVTAAAQKVWTGTAQPGVGLIFNNSAVDIFVGPAGVTTATGIKVSAGGGYLDTWPAGVDMYAIAAVAGPNNLTFYQFKWA